MGKIAEATNEAGSCLGQGLAGAVDLDDVDVDPQVVDHSVQERLALDAAVGGSRLEGEVEVADVAGNDLASIGRRPLRRPRPGRVSRD